MLMSVNKNDTNHPPNILYYKRGDRGEISTPRFRKDTPNLVFGMGWIISLILVLQPIIGAYFWYKAKSKEADSKVEIKLIETAEKLAMQNKKHRHQ